MFGLVQYLFAIEDEICLGAISPLSCFTVRGNTSIRPLNKHFANLAKGLRSAVVSTPNEQGG